MKPSKYLLSAHLAISLFGISGLFGKWLSLPAELITLGRCFWGAFFLLLVLLFHRSKFPSINRNQLFFFAGTGILLAFHWTAFFKGIQLSGVATGLLSFATFPVFVAILSPLITKESFTLKKGLMVFITALGVSLLSPKGYMGVWDKGMLWGVLSGLSFAVLVIMNKRWVSRYSSLELTCYQLIFAGLSLAILFGKNVHIISYQDFFLLIVLGSIFTGLSHWIFIWSLKGISSQTASLITCLEPVYGILASVIIWRTIPDYYTLMGGILIMSVAIYATISSE